jgi:hypothetical protein
MSSNFTHTPRREPRRSGAHTPHTPGERELNIVSRVGVAATAETGVVRGLLCVKVRVGL